MAPIEGHFYALLLEKLGLDATELPDRDDPKQWATLREKMASIFASQTQDHWCGLLEGTDACFAPVLNFCEARERPHHVARGTFVEGGTMPEMVPTPLLDRTPGEAGPSPA